jgi:uncharacterized delta-60 repeat protein
MGNFSVNSLLCIFSRAGRRAMLSLRAALAFIFAFAIASAFAQFGDGTGQVRIPKLGSSTSPEFGEAIALQPDGKIIVGGDCLEGVCVVRLNADGTIDTAFNPGGSYPGKVVLPWTLGSSTTGITMRLAIDEAGRILFATTCRATLGDPNRFCIARFTANGALDASFTGPGSASGQFLIPVTTDNNTFRAMHIARWTTATSETRRRILLVGACGVSFQCIAVLNYDNGSLDNTFDPPASALANGLFSWQIASSNGNRARGVISQSGVDDNGKIVVAGSCSFGGTASVCLTKFNTDGSFDSDFKGPDGTASGAFILYAYRAPGNPNLVDQVGIDLAEADDGRYYLLCTHDNSSKLCIYRLNRDGSLDESFDNGGAFPTIKGRVVFDLNSNASARLAIDKTIDGLRGAPVVAADCNGPCVTRYRGTGAIDASLTGPNGDAAGQFYFDPGQFNDSVNDLVVNALGEIFVVGTCNGQICVIKFRQDGSLFTSVCNRNVDGDFNVSAASDGMAIVRKMRGFTGTPAIPNGLGYDIDGDGELNAARDGVLLLRRMLGFEGDAVMNGVSFETWATRKTWPQIESYLRTRCRIPVAPPPMVP